MSIKKKGDNRDDETLLPPATKETTTTNETTARQQLLRNLVNCSTHTYSGNILQRYCTPSSTPIHSVFPVQNLIAIKNRHLVVVLILRLAILNLTFGLLSI